MKKNDIVLMLYILAGFTLIFTIWFTNPLNHGAETIVEDSPYYTVADNEINQYEIVARQGDLREMYAQASLCAETFLQLQKEDQYKIWKNRTDSIDRQMHRYFY